MDDSRTRNRLEVEQILQKIVADFELLDGTIDAAIALLGAGDGQAEEVEALRRARTAVRRGAALARRNLDSE